MLQQSISVKTLSLAYVDEIYLLLKNHYQPNREEHGQGDTTARVHALQPSGACRTVINTEDRRELLKLWEHGRDTEQRRIEAQRKKQQAQKDNVVNHPAIYDEIFCQELLGVAV